MNGAAKESVDICVCTYRRPGIAETLRSLFAQEAKGLALRVIVADNDGAPSAKARVEALAREAPFPVLYIHAPERNISVARNACLDAATAEWLAFIDDDETAPPGWIAALHAAATADRLDVVFGPVIARYPEDAPDWIREGDYLSSRAPVQPNGELRTGHSGNVLIRWAGGACRRERFLLSKGRTGGEDVEFFFRLSRMGLSLGVAEAAAYEDAPPARLDYRWIRRRRFLAGQFHGAHSEPAEGSRGLYRARLIAGSGLKAGYCALRALLGAFRPAERRRWTIRAALHLGVCAGAFGIGETEQY